MPVMELQPSDPSAVGPFRLLGRLATSPLRVEYLAAGGADASSRAVVTAVPPELVGRDQRATATADVRAQASTASQMARAASGASGLVRLLSTGDDGDAPWLATEHVDGPSLAEAAAGGGLPSDEVRELAAALAGCLAAVHAAGYAHGGVRPSHVVLSPDGIRLVGLGQARRAGEVVEFRRTRAEPWDAPEPLDPFRDPRPRDVHAWGAVVAFAATGSPAGVGPAGADLAEPLAGLVSAALRPNPLDRPRAASIAADLGAVVGTGSLPHPPSRHAPASRRRGAAAVAACAAMAAGGMLLARGLAPAPEVVLADEPAAPGVSAPAAASDRVDVTTSAVASATSAGTTTRPSASTARAAGGGIGTGAPGVTAVADGSAFSSPLSTPGVRSTGSASSSPPEPGAEGTGTPSGPPAVVPGDPSPTAEAPTSSSPSPASSTPTPSPSATGDGGSHDGGGHGRGHGHDKPRGDRDGTDLLDAVVSAWEQLVR